MAAKMLIIQFKMTGAPGELAWLHDIEDMFIQAFEQNGAAELDGHDYGSGTMNIFIRPQGPWGSVIDIVKAYLKHRELLKDATIVKRLPSDRYVVVWPLDFQGEFALM